MRIGDFAPSQLAALDTGVNGALLRATHRAFVREALKDLDIQAERKGAGFIVTITALADEDTVAWSEQWEVGALGKENEHVHVELLLLHVGCVLERCKKLKAQNAVEIPQAIERARARLAGQKASRKRKTCSA